MAKWVRGRTFGTSMCDKCNYEIPYTEYRRSNTPDPDECPHCGAYMENGYGNVQKELTPTVFSALASVRNEVIPENYNIYGKDEIKMWEKAFESFINVLQSEANSASRKT